MATDRAFLLHYARVLIAQARHFREREQRLGWAGWYSASLLEGACKATRQAMAVKPAASQGELFA